LFGGCGFVNYFGFGGLKIVGYGYDSVWWVFRGFFFFWGGGVKCWSLDYHRSDSLGWRIAVSVGHDH